MGVKTRKDGNGREYEYVTYDREQKATFNSYSQTELTAFRTLMKSVGGVQEVAYELYKLVNSFTESSKVFMHFITVEITCLGGKVEILTPEELAYQKYLFLKDKENKGKEFEYVELARDGKKLMMRDYFFRSPAKVQQYTNRVNSALNWNRTSNKDTKNIVKLLNKLAHKLHERKKRQFIGVNQWLIGKEDKPENYEDLKITKKVINTISAKKEIDDPHEQD
jgi:hypothetical protein